MRESGTDYSIRYIGWIDQQERRNNHALLQVLLNKQGLEKKVGRKNEEKNTDHTF